jgi:uncharacterized protein YjbI with pentapeptide repeats
MPNEKHLNILERGVDAWNRWRDEHREVTPDLQNVILRKKYLRGANLRTALLQDSDLSESDLSQSQLAYALLQNSSLSNANLTGAILSHANLAGANLTRANLSKTDCSKLTFYDAKLVDANLAGSDLRETVLSGTDCRDTVFREANLELSDLRGANLSGADLSHAKLKYVRMGKTILAGNNLREVQGLENVWHSGPSEISVSTIGRSEGLIPEKFLRGCGLSDWELESTKLYQTGLSPNQITNIVYRVNELRMDPLIQFYSCFISYSSTDEEFAQRLYSDLQRSGVRCWFAPEDMKIGAQIRDSLEDSIRLHDKLLLVLSATSIASQWVEHEVETALQKERERGTNVLFPVRLDDAVMKKRGGWAALVKKTRHIGDFSQWNDFNGYQKGFSRLITDLGRKPVR